MKKNKFLTSIMAVFVGVLMLVGTVGLASAQEGTSIKISPVLFEDLTADPGEQLTGEIDVSNPGSDAIVLYPTAQNFLPKAGNEDGMPELTESDTPYAMMEWISFDKTSVDLAPGAKDTVKFFITVPADATPGGHYGSLLFSTKAPEGAPETTQLKVESAVSALVLLRVSGDIREEGNVVSFTTSGLTDGNVVDFELKFENTGNTHVKPTGDIVITNWLGSKVAEVKMEGENVLPNSTRNLTATWQPQGALFGKYTATITGAYGTANKAFTAETSFSQYHFTTLLIILVIIILIILFIKMSSKSYKEELSKEIKEEMKR